MRSTAGTRTALTPRAQADGRRTSARPAASEARTTGAARPTLREARAKSGDSPRTTRGGWAGYRQAREERTSKYPRVEVPDKGGVLLRFAEHEPFDFIYRHWVNKRPLTCLRGPEDDVDACPLCVAALENGDVKAKPVVFYNVIVIDTEGVRLMVWELTSEPARQVEKQYDRAVANDKTLDDPGLYFYVTKERKDNGFFDYDLERILASNLAEEGHGDPLEDHEVENALRRGLFTSEVIYRNSRDQIIEAAKGATSRSDED